MTTTTTTEKFYIIEWSNRPENLKEYKIDTEFYNCVLNDGNWTGFNICYDEKNPVSFETEEQAQEKIKELEAIDELGEKFWNCHFLSDLEDLNVSGFDFFINNPDSDFPIHFFKNPKELRSLLKHKKEHEGFTPQGARVFLRATRQAQDIFFD